MDSGATPATGAPYIAVVGPGDGATDEQCAVAEQIGGLLADRRAILVCGGLGGVMEAAARGARARGGQAVGLLPGTRRGDGNSWLSVALPTGLGELRNGLVVGVSDAVIAVGGSWGTQSEIALAMRAAKPTVAVGGWEVRMPGSGAADRPRSAGTAESAVREIFAELEARSRI